jgi:cytochrome c biogenesis factor
MATWGATVSFAGGRMRRADLIESGERAIYATLAMVVLASLGLWTALLTHDFSIRYVASYTSANLPKVYTITAFWAGQSGSLLFWALILSIYSAIALWTNRTRNRELMPYVTSTLALMLVFFLAPICLASNPFERLEFVPLDGRGLNPQLQSPGMAIHPPSLYLGYVGTSIPFAFAIAALLTRRVDAEWLAAVRRWALLAWFFITVAIVIGMRWAYVEPGWAGYWAWNPVENASLLPWLVNTAFLYSILLGEKRGMLRKWNVTLVVSTFLLSIFAAFVVPRGMVSGIHSFAQPPARTWFAVFLVVAIAVTAYLVSARLNDYRSHAEFAQPRLIARKRPRYGRYIVQLGLVALIAGFAGRAFKREFDLTLNAGESSTVTDAWGHGWTFLNQGISRYNVLNREVTAIALDVWRDGKPSGVITSEKRQHFDSRGAPTFDPSTEVGIQGSFKEDVYVVLAAVRGADGAEIHVTFNPLVRWVWIGGALVALGGIVVMWPVPDLVAAVRRDA